MVVAAAVVVVVVAVVVVVVEIVEMVLVVEAVAVPRVYLGRGGFQERIDLGAGVRLPAGHRRRDEPPSSLPVLDDDAGLLPV